LTNENGTMARLPEIIDFAMKYDIAVVAVEDIVQYRKRIAMNHRELVG
jgi:3,4-dihydroxy 2-butanone 4-phosphate synthase